MKKKVVIFGAGQIGRGFIGDVCSAENYFLVYVDVFENLVNQLNEKKCYPLWILGVEKKIEKTISNLKAIHFSEKETIAKEISETSLVFTAVGANNLENLAPLIAGGIEKKFSQKQGEKLHPHLSLAQDTSVSRLTDSATVLNGAHSSSHQHPPPSRGRIKERGKGNSCALYLNIVICENLLGSSKVLYTNIIKHLPEAFHKFLDKNVGLVETVVSRMVAPLSDDLKKTNPLLVRVEEYNILPVDKKSFKGEIPQIKAFYPVDPLFPYEELKLFVHNLAHATIAYLGYLKGYQYIWEGMEDKEIIRILDGVLEETKTALMKKHSFSRNEIENYISDLKKRFKNKLLGDTVYRVGRDPLRKIGSEERLIGGIKLCLSQNIFPKNICFVAGACLCYNYGNDEEAMKLQKYLSEKGIDFVLKNICKLDKGSSVYALIKEKYKEVEGLKTILETLKFDYRS